MPVKVAFMQLSSCWGCHQSLLNAHLGLLQILPELEIVYWPTVVDFKLESLKAREDGEIVVGFLEGCVRTKQDRDNVLLMRKKCKIIVAFGTCSIYGSVAGLGNLWTKEELLKKKFIDADSVVEGRIPYEYVTPLEERFFTAPQLIKVVVKLPGCPPITQNIVDAVLFLLGKNPDYKPSEKSVCDECEMEKEDKILKEIKRDYESLPDPSICLINQGYLCMGPGTLAGCGAQCPSANAPCVGCYGPTPNVKDHSFKLLSTFATISELPHEELTNKISDPVGVFSRFTLATSKLLNKKRDK